MNLSTRFSLLVLLSCSGAVAAAPPVSAPVQTLPAVGASASPAPTPVQPAALSLTIYQQGFAVVRDERTVELGLGLGELLIPDVSAQIVPGSTLVNGQGSLEVKAIHYVGANLTPAALLASYVGRGVSVLRNDPRDGRLIREPAELLGVAGERPIVRIGDRVEIGGPEAGWRLALDGVPAALSGRSGLSLELDNPVRGPQSLELVYLTRGIGWQADYVGVLDPRSQRLRLSGWASIANDTDVGFEQARLQLLAGDVNQVATPMRMYAMAEGAARAKDGMASAASFDYRIYSLPAPVSLAPGQRTQVPLLAMTELPVQRQYRVVGAGFESRAEPQPLSVAVRLKLDNRAPALGKPLPAGIVRIYGEGEQGQLQLLGEDRIDHSAVGETLEIGLGNAFDLHGERSQTSYRKIDQHTAEIGWSIRLSNAKQEPVAVVVEERMAGDWSLLEASRPLEQRTAASLQWRLEIAAGASETLSYRAQMRF